MYITEKKNQFCWSEVPKMNEGGGERERERERGVMYVCMCEREKSLKSG